MERVVNTGITCWQCSEYNINFTFVLSVIPELSARHISTTTRNIGTRLHARDGINAMSDGLLQEVIDYAEGSGYISRNTVSKETVYAINQSFENNCCCDLCGEKLEPFVPQEYVDISTFGSFVNDVRTLKENLKGPTDVLGITDDTNKRHHNDMYEIKLNEMKGRHEGEKERLLKKMEEKESAISFLLEFLTNKFQPDTPPSSTS